MAIITFQLPTFNFFLLGWVLGASPFLNVSSFAVIACWKKAKKQDVVSETFNVEAFHFSSSFFLLFLFLSSFPFVVWIGFSFGFRK